MADIGCAKAQVGIFESGVGKSVAEGVFDLFFRAVVIAVSNIDALAVFDCSGAHTEVFRAEIIVFADGEGFGKFARGIDLAVQEIVGCFAACLTAEIDVENGFDALVPFADFHG